MARKKLHLKTQRKIGGKVFTRTKHTGYNKRDAEHKAGLYRADNINARVLKDAKGYSVWKGGKSKRSHCGYCGRTTRKGRGMCKYCSVEH